MIPDSVDFALWALMDETRRRDEQTFPDPALYQDFHRPAIRALIRGSALLYALWAVAVVVTAALGALVT